MRDGTAMDRWRRMIAAQGGDPAAPLPGARQALDIRAPRSGVLTRLDAFGVGVAAWRLGAGRALKEHAVDPGAGVEWFAVPGDPVSEGQVLLTLHSDDEHRFAGALEALTDAIVVGEPGEPVDRLPLVIDRVGS